MGSGGDRRTELKGALQHLNRQFARCVFQAAAAAVRRGAAPGG
jgi:hypothetical protein